MKTNLKTIIDAIIAYNRGKVHLQVIMDKCMAFEKELKEILSEKREPLMTQTAMLIKEILGE